MAKQILVQFQIWARSISAVPGEPVQENHRQRPNLHSTDRQAERGDLPPRTPHGHAAGQNARPGKAYEISVRHWVRPFLTWAWPKYSNQFVFQWQHQHWHFWCKFVPTVSAQPVHHRLAEGGAGGQEHREPGRGKWRDVRDDGARCHSVFKYIGGSESSLVSGFLGQSIDSGYFSRRVCTVRIARRALWTTRLEIFFPWKKNCGNRHSPPPTWPKQSTSFSARRVSDELSECPAKWPIYLIKPIHESVVLQYTFPSVVYPPLSSLGCIVIEKEYYVWMVKILFLLVFSYKKRVLNKLCFVDLFFWRYSVWFDLHFWVVYVTGCCNILRFSKCK